MADHSPLPWRQFTENGVVFIVDSSEKSVGLMYADDNDAADAAYIVRACDSFPYLLAALKAHVAFQRGGGDLGAIMAASEAAIAKAEGK